MPLPSKTVSPTNRPDVSRDEQPLRKKMEVVCRDMANYRFIA